MVGTVLWLFVRFLQSCGLCLWREIQDRLAGRRLDWRPIDVVMFCWNDFTLRVALCWRASQYDRRMRKLR
jgi:hypothetical protein